MKTNKSAWFLQTNYVRFILFANIAGTIYGFWWYKEQLGITPYRYWLFTPDCPFYTLLFSFVLIEALSRAKNKEISLKGDWFSTIVYFGLIKYGAWTIFVLILSLSAPGVKWQFQDTILLISHGGMLIEGVLFLPRPKIKTFPGTIAFLWFLLNDYLDYFHGVYPTLPAPEQFQTIKLFAFSTTFILWGILISLHKKGRG
jgi:uncharacterized membrane protein YpjA